MKASCGPGGRLLGPGSRRAIRLHAVTLSQRSEPKAATGLLTDVPGPFYSINQKAQRLACDAHFAEDEDFFDIMAHLRQEKVMAEIRTVTALRSMHAEIISSIASYEKRLARARADLSRVNACIATPATSCWRTPWRRGIHALRQQWRRGLISGEGKVKGTRVCALQQGPLILTKFAA